MKRKIHQSQEFGKEFAVLAFLQISLQTRKLTRIFQRATFLSMLFLETKILIPEKSFILQSINTKMCFWENYNYL